MGTPSSTDTWRQVALVTGAASLLVLGNTSRYGPREALRSPAVPAGPTFAIWLPIYAGVIGLVARHSATARRADPALRGIGWPLALVLGAAGAWQRAFARKQLALSLPLIGGTWLAAGQAYRRLPPRAASARERWLVYVPLGALFGWLTVAAAAGATEQLLDPEASGLDLDPDPLAIGAVAAVGAAASALTVGVPRTLAFPAAVAWGLAGIVAVDRRDAPLVAAAAGVALLGLAAAAFSAAARPTA